MVIKPQFNTDKNTQGCPKFVFEKEYFFEQDSYLGDGIIPLKFMFNGCNYYTPFLQANVVHIVRVGAPILRGVQTSFNNLMDLIEAIPPRASLNAGLRKLFLYLKVASNIAKGTKLAAGYSEAAEVIIIIILSKSLHVISSVLFTITEK